MTTKPVWLRTTEAVRRHAFTEPPKSHISVRSRCGTVTVHGKHAWRRWHKHRPFKVWIRQLHERTHHDGPRCRMCSALLTLDKVKAVQRER